MEHLKGTDWGNKRLNRVLKAQALSVSKKRIFVEAYYDWVIFTLKFLVLFTPVHIAYKIYTLYF